jgi:hypothetical protein
MVPALLLAWSAVPARAADLSEYHLVTPTEALPAKPWHDCFIDETVATPAGQVNFGTTLLDFFLSHSLDNTLQTTAAQSRWETSPDFFSWAIWGYLSPDSKYRGDERLVTMSQTWLDTLFTTLTTKPTDPKTAATWQPNRLDTWSFHLYTLPLLEVLHRPELAARLGADRVEHFRQIVLDNVRLNTTPEAYNKLMEGAETYVNPAVHPMAVFIHGWQLTGDRKYLLMAYRIIHLLGRDQLPNGMFPYRYRLQGPRHCEFETMYYHNMDIRGLYLYWWATGSKEAEAILRKSAPYYPLNLEPPYYFNDGPDIWWKYQWRTFWPLHIAMVAAVTGDGENATIADDMARDSVSSDRIDLVLGWHAYQQMGLRHVAAQPVRQDYLIQDQDIRGLRLRFGRWSSTFTTGSFTYTRASAMRVGDDLKSFTAFHLGRPYLRVAPLEQAARTENDYSTLGHEGADYTAALGAREAAAATVYAPALTAATWDEHQPLAPWQMREVWLLTPDGMVGLMESVATADNQARELCHQFRFLAPGREAEGEKAGEGEYTLGGLRFHVWDTDLPYTIVERARRYTLAEHDRGEWQVSLSDTDRSPEQLAQDPPVAGQPAPGLKLPQTHAYAAGYRRFSLVSVAPLEATWSEVSCSTRERLVALHAQCGTRHYLVVHNAGPAPIRYGTSDPVTALVASWDPRAPLPARPHGRLTLAVPAGGVALLTW